MPQNEEEYDFDFSKRQVELISINEKWISYPTSEAAKNQLSVLSLSLRDFVFELIDEGHPSGKETIKRNLELGELCGQILSQSMGASYRLGLEYGNLGAQSTPIEGPDSVPQEAKEMFIVAFQMLNNLFLKLISDIYHARVMTKKIVVEKQENFNSIAFGTMISCYRFGVATATET
ncbi:MAG: hypothetical protein WBF08_00980 [Candidatus Bathyarchaeia archaeon]